ncbi:hypothetical protein BROUX41_000754 [Berkeleyomyces rouxiae]|uniref:uncharacterized protein n=1 Tax=Berkeleyomyces rouxiae TaxID=2035830 RepID=UPI003B7AD0B8
MTDLLDEPKYGRFHFTRVGVAAVIYNAEGKVLTGVRLSKGQGNGALQFPGGHLEKDESTFSCVRREAKEETGLDVLVDCQPFAPDPLRSQPASVSPAPAIRTADFAGLAAPPLEPFAHTPDGSGPVDYKPLKANSAATPWEARPAAVVNQMFSDDGRHYITLFVRCVVRDADEVPRVMEPDKCQSWEWRSWEEIKAYEREGYGKLFAPLPVLLSQYRGDQDLYKRPTGDECLLL